MSAPIAASAPVGSTNLLFTSSILNPVLAVAPVGMWAKVSISPPSELAREAGEAETVGAADRPHIRRPFLPIVPRRDQGFWVMIRGELAIERGSRAAISHEVDPFGS